MTTVTIKLSQAVVDQGHALATGMSMSNGTPGNLLDFIMEAAAAIEEDYSEFTSWSLLGSTLRTTYADGATGVYSGLVLENPTASRGRASVTGFDFTKPGLVDLGVTGKFSYDYDISGNALSLQPSADGLTINSLRLATRLPTTSPDYDPTLGNISLSLNGALKLLPSGDVSGSIQRLDLSADKFIRSMTVEGNILPRIGMLNGTAFGLLDGTLSAYTTTFHDGSTISATSASAFMLASESLQEALLRGTAGTDDISVELPGRLYELVVIRAGEGDDIIAVKGGGGRLQVAAGDGNDVVSLLGDRQSVDGGLGMDTVKLAGAQADYVLKRVVLADNPDPRNPPVSQYSLTDKSGAASTLANVERIVFANATLALDVDGNAGQAYRLYQAAFDRTPDAVGLGFWINSLDKGLSLTAIAAAFMTQAEFKTAYGNSQSNLELVTRFYQNILGRDPEAAGRDFWVGKLDQKAVGVAEVLAAISESAENKAGLVDIIGNGFTYTPWGGS